MKFAAIALSLGCAALACKLAAQFPLPNPETSLTALPPLRQALGRLESFAPHIELPATPPEAVLREARLPLRQTPLLPRSETLVLIGAAASKHNVPAVFIQSIVAAESNFDCTAVSPRGAIGLMQLMPQTAQQFGADPTIPSQNIDAGTRYLRWLMDRYGNSRQHVIAAYNAGPGNVDRYHGVPPFKETRSYVTRVLGFLRQFEGTKKHSADRG